MTGLEAYQRLQAFSVFRTVDAAVLLDISVGACNKILSRMALRELVIRLSRGLWTWPGVDPHLLPEQITAPAPSYISFQSALYIHGMIAQIPQVTYVATLSRAHTVNTPLGGFSFHHLPAAWFFGFALHGEQGVKVATPEKALLDTLYLSPAKSRLFAALPEIEIPASFDMRKAHAIIDRIPSARRRTMVKKRFHTLMTAQVSPKRPRRR